MRMSVRTRRAVSRVCIGFSLACLLALVAVAPLRQHAVARGWGIAACAVISIAGALYYLRASRGRS